MNEAEKARQQLAVAGVELTQDNYQQFVKAGDQEKLDLFKAAGFSTNRFFGANFAWACAVGEVDIVRQEISKADDLNRFLDWNPPMTPLMLACLHGHVRVTELLLEAGADPNTGRPVETPQGEVVAVESPIFFATRAGNRKIIDLLKKHGANGSQGRSQGRPGPARVRPRK